MQSKAVVWFKIIFALLCALVVLGFGYFQAFTGLVLGHTFFDPRPGFGHGAMVAGTPARIVGGIWLLLTLLITVAFIRKFIQGYRDR